MIPIWAKDRTGKWKVFPQEKLCVHRDGKVGVSFRNDNVPFYMEWKHLFDYDALNYRYVLRKQPTNE